MHIPSDTKASSSLCGITLGQRSIWWIAKLFYSHWCYTSLKNKIHSLFKQKKKGEKKGPNPYLSLHLQESQFLIHQLFPCIPHWRAVALRENMGERFNFKTLLFHNHLTCTGLLLGKCKNCTLTPHDSHRKIFTKMRGKRLTRYDLHTVNVYGANPLADLRAGKRRKLDSLSCAVVVINFAESSILLSYSMVLLKKSQLPT